MKTTKAVFGILAITMSIVGRAAASWILPLLLLVLPAVVKAQYTYEFTNNTITITGYSGSGGAVVIPSEVNNVPVTSIGYRAFYGCTSLTSVEIPDSITSIGDYAFQSTSLTTLRIPNSVTNIGDWAFYSCVNLTSLTIGGSVTNIGLAAFNSCIRLTSLTIGGSVATIENAAFESCYSLTNANIPKSVTTIGMTVFSMCSSLSSVYFEGNAPTIDSSAFSSDSYLTAYYLPGTSGWGPFLANRPAVLWNTLVQPGTFGVRTNQLGFNIAGSSNLVVVIEASTNLVNPTWYPLQTNTLNGTSLYFSDPQWTNYGSRFYRLSMP